MAFSLVSPSPTALQSTFLHPHRDLSHDANLTGPKSEIGITLPVVVEGAIDPSPRYEIVCSPKRTVVYSPPSGRGPPVGTVLYSVCMYVVHTHVPGLRYVHARKPSFGTSLYLS